MNVFKANKEGIILKSIEVPLLTITVNFWHATTNQPAFTCSMLAIEILEQGVKVCSKLTIKKPERRQWRRAGLFNVNFEKISHLALVFLLLTLNKQLPAGHGFTFVNVAKCHNSFKTYNLFIDQSFSANIYLFKLNNRNTRKRRETTLTIKITGQTQLSRAGVFTVNFEHILHFL